MGNRVKVLECIRQGQIGGGESHLLSLVENMDMDQYEPVVLSFTDGPMVDRLQAMQVKTHVIHTLRPFDISKWGRVKKLLQEERIALVHAHGTRACSNTIWAARSLGIPVIYTVHGWSFHADQQALLRNLRIQGERYLVNRADMTISVSASNKDSGKKFIPSLESVVINNGINYDKFSPERSFTDIRSALGISKDKVLVLFIARFTAHKQPLTLIRAFLRAVEKDPGMHLLMVGEGDERGQASDILAAAGDAAKSVTVLNFRQDVPDILQAADIYVLPSLWEGLPIGLLEAMAMGKAVIATGVDGTREIVTDGENGILVQPGDIASLEHALLALAADPGQRKALGRKAREKVGLHFNARVMTEKIETLYKDILEKKH